MHMETVIKVDLGDAIDNDVEGWLDLISEKACGTAYPDFSDIKWWVVGHEDRDTLLLKVAGEYEPDDDD